MQTLLIANAVGERIGDFLEGNGDVVPSSTLQEAAANIEKGIVKSLTTRLAEGLEDIRKHITDSIDSIVIPPLLPKSSARPWTTETHWSRAGNAISTTCTPCIPCIPHHPQMTEPSTPNTKRDNSPMPDSSYSTSLTHRRGSCYAARA